MKKLENNIYRELVRNVIEQAYLDIRSDHSIRTTPMDTYEACIFLENINLDWLGIFDESFQEKIYNRIQKFTQSEEFAQKKAAALTKLTVNRENEVCRKRIPRKKPWRLEKARLAQVIK
jgi:hypothetical protein